MKNREDKNIEKLVKNMMAETSVESPSIDFVGKVMTGIYAAEKNKVFVYKPIISKRAWFIILAVIVFLFAFLLFKIQETSAANNFNLTFLNSDKLLKSFPGFEFSTLTANVLFAASAMVFIQTILLKAYLNRRFK